MSQTVVGLFDEYNEAQAAVSDLIDAGFRRDDISVIANNTGDRFSAGSSADSGSGDAPASSGHGVGTRLVGGAAEGAVLGGLTGLAASLALLLIPGVGPILAVGPLAATLSGAGLGAVGGGVIGGLSGLGIPKEDASHYAEGIRRGGTLVTVQTDDAQGQAAADILNRHHPLDIDHRGDYHRSTGFTGCNEEAPHYTPEQITEDRTQYRASVPTVTATTATVAPAIPVSHDQTVAAGDTVTVPVIEEELAVGKRQVQRGGARLHTYVIETPVSEQVSLHEEHVTVDRHAVDRPVSQADLANALQERTFEVTETAEVPVVAKEARVVEEVTIGKQASDRTETISDTVRRTEVDVDELDDDTVTGTGTGTGTGVTTPTR